MTDIFEYLKNNEYPGRGILVGSFNSKRVIAYFIMGRSLNSRNRVFKKDGDILFTKAFDESKAADPSLIIYNAIRSCGDISIVTNGNQTDTIFDYLKQGKTFEEALSVREYEPDQPNYTPRISAIVTDSGYQISILKKNGDSCERLYWNYEAEEGIAHFISTYDHNGDPLPSFSKEPIRTTIDADLSQKFWDALNKENRISLYVLIDGKETIFNQNEGD